MKVTYSVVLLVAISLFSCGGGGSNEAGNSMPVGDPTVVFRAVDSVGVSGLWATIDDGSNMLRLDPDFELIPNIPRVTSFKISPNKAWVAFSTQNVSAGNGIRLWVNSIQGGTPVEIITFANASTRIKDYI